MANLKIMDLYNNAEDGRINSFSRKINSSLKVSTDYEKVERNYDWLELMENTIRYIDNILRNPNKFIINEEDVIKVEQVKKVTVESIKHLSRNTNLIQEIDKKTGDVRPSKLLNITKEESFDTYENRLIYSLIQNMKFFLNRKKNDIDIQSSLKDKKTLEYSATTQVGKEKVDINLNLNTNLDAKNNNNNNLENIITRMKALEVNINALCSNDVYKTIERLHISLITPPVKKTNLIMKNVNFQYAMKLWDFLHEHVDDDIKEIKDNQKYNDNSKLKEYLDETFLLNYLTANSLSHEELEISKDELSNKIVENMLERVMDLKDIPLEELQKIIGDKYQKIKYRNTVSDKKIIEIFKDKINKYIERVEEAKL